MNAMDLNILRRILSGTVTPDEQQNLAGDLNGDGVVNGVDSNKLTRLIAGSN